MNRRPLALAAVLAVGVTALGASQLLPGAAPSASAAGLVGWASCDDLLEHYRSELRASVGSYGGGYYLEGDAAVQSGGVARGAGDSATASGREAASAPGAASDGDTGAVGRGATGTNLQEQDVDEPDLAKLRDGRLVLVTGNRLRLLSAAAQPQELGSMRLGDGQTWGGELLLVGERAVVVTSGYRERPIDKPGAGDVSRLMPYLPGTPTTRVTLVDLSNDQPRLIEESTYDTQYVGARLVGDTVRLVTTNRPQPPMVFPQMGGPLVDVPAVEGDVSVTEERSSGTEGSGGTAGSSGTDGTGGAGGTPLTEEEALAANRKAAGEVPLTEVLPQMQRKDAGGAVLESGNAVGCEQTFHADKAAGASTLLVTTLRPGDGLAATDRTAVTTDGDLVYAAADRLYVATSRWNTVAPMPMQGLAGNNPRAAAVPDEVSTELHAFDTSSATSTRYVGSGSVPGYVMGRWALSYHEGALRVATTRQPPWESNGAQPEQAAQTSSMLVKLAEQDGDLVETGRVEGLGKTEQIRAVRYFGDVAAVVTFRQTDPLYLLDLSGPPKVLGELKIPGFSTYLHPLGDGKLLGLGQDATDDGQVTGVAVSVFDISDLTKPALLDKLRLGQGWSSALDDSRAFGYDPDRRLVTMPFTSWDPTGQGGERNSALGITVAEDGTLRTTGRLDLPVGQWPQRVLLDDSHAYAVTETSVVAADAATFDRTGSIEFPLPGTSIEPDGSTGVSPPSP